MTTANSKMSIDAGQIILNEGDPGGNLMIIESGMVEVFQSRNGHDIILAQLGPGEMLGVMTILDERRRAASVRAKTNVVINEIPPVKIKKLINEIPSWATSIIRDLVTRVHQADALYTKAKSKGGDAVVAGSHLRAAVQVAEGFAPLAEILVKGGRNELPVHEILTDLAKILGIDAEVVGKVFDIFTTATLMESRGPGGSVRATLERLYQLQTFSKFVETHLTSDRLSLLVTAFTVNERSYLRHCLTAIEQMSDDPDCETIIPIQKLENALTGKNKKRFDPHPLKEANHLGLLTMEASDIGNTIQLIPAEFRLTLSIIDSLCMIDELELPEHKLSHSRTLIY